jgi:Ca2+-binding EF-hand superfamily protein
MKAAAADHFEKLLCTTRSSIVKAFSAMDKDESGIITQLELGEAFQTLGVNATEAEVESIFQALDENSDGAINFEVATQSGPPLTIGCATDRCIRRARCLYR